MATPAGAAVRRWLRRAARGASLPERRREVVEPGGVEPPASALQRRRSPG